VIVGTAVKKRAIASAVQSPFYPDNEKAYRSWRERKLADYPLDAGEITVEIGNPRALKASEHAAILACCRKTNMVIYAGRVHSPDKDIPRLLGQQLGLSHLDHNWLADEDGVSSVTVSTREERLDYIPYSNRPLKWHTDGYYNPPARRIEAWMLHCIVSAPHGGENALLDHEMVYLLMRDASSDHIRALMEPDVMTIPARADEEGTVRAAQTGPVFSVHPVTGNLHMRYTARTRSIQWKQDPATLSALGFLEKFLARPSPYIYRCKLEPGMGIISNNVLHERTGFRDDKNHRRLLYRARYHDRIKGTEAVV
jgi:hypothetical protein